MKIDLTGKTAVVSGSGQGIGLAIGAGLAGAGASVVLNTRSADRVNKAVDRLRCMLPGAEITGVAADLGTEDGVRMLLDAVPDADILVNNLGIFEPQEFLDITDADWHQMFDTNLMSGVRLSRGYLPGMLARNTGRIVFVSSESALQIPPEMIHYGVTKIAQLALSRGLAELCAGTEITVNSVLVGPTASEGVADFVNKLGGEGKPAQQAVDDFVRDHRPTSILRRASTPEEIANMVVYLCSPQAAATTGAAVSVDGGVRRSAV
jgi:NAD(P)-dependent dehydrogenase (short-subunit alcohol dehydrogenase family)